MNTQVCDPRPRSALGTRGRASVCPVEVVLGGRSPEDAWLTALGKGWAEEGDRKRESEERPGRGKRHQSCSISVSDSFPLDPTVQSMEFSSQDTGVGSHSLPQGIFPTQDRTQVSRIAGGFFTS